MAANKEPIFVKEILNEFTNITTPNELVTGADLVGGGITKVLIATGATEGSRVDLVRIIPYALVDEACVISLTIDDGVGTISILDIGSMFPFDPADGSAPLAVEFKPDHGVVNLKAGARLWVSIWKPTLANFGGVSVVAIGGDF